MAENIATWLRNLTTTWVRDNPRRTAERCSEAAVEIDRQREALAEVIRLRLATDEGSLARRADRMWEVASAALGQPLPGAKPFQPTAS